jgi:amino acid adenylation domain-containing protein
VPLRSLLLTAHLKVVSILSGKSDVVTGAVCHSRPEEEDGDKVLGLFLNSVPFRCKLAPGSWRTLIRAVVDSELSMLPHRAYPYFQILLDNGRAPLYETLFNYVHFHVYDAAESAPTMETLGSAGAEATSHAFGVNFVHRAGRLSLDFEVDPARMSALQRSRIAGYFRAVLGSIAFDVDSAHEAQCFLSAAERQQFIHGWNPGIEASTAVAPVHAAFERQARLTPDAVAVMHGEAQLSYAELNARANCLASQLRELGATTDDRVAIFMERGLNLILAQLAVLKAGAAYVPLDPQAPLERLASVLQDCAPRAILSEHCLESIWGTWQPRIPVLNVDLVLSRGQNPQTQTFDSTSDDRQSDSLALLIYTSGSTGVPKGVMVEHRQLGRQIESLRSLYAITAHDRVLQFSATSFDTSVEEIFCALTGGATLVLRTDAWLADAAEFWRLCAASKISVVDLPTRYWKMLAESAEADIPACVRLVIIGGEAVDRGALAAWFSRGDRPRLLNTYGPTEATIVATAHAPAADLGDWRSIGRPVGHNRVYVLDAHRQPVPLGTIGEVYISGAGVARGYFARPDLTAERFSLDDFVADGGTRMYRSGDLAHWRADGTVEYVGRNDSQVKLRGYRIELGEIEARLRQHPQLSEAVVTLDDSTDEPRLLAYCVPVLGDGESARVKVETLHEHLRAALPEYMLPSAFVLLQDLPLTVSGKLDRNALPAPGQVVVPARAYEPPQGEVEAAVAELWCSLLGVEHVGRHDDFFALGGHSLSVLRCVAELRRRGFPATVADLFQSPVLHSLAERLGRAGAQDAEPAAILIRGGGERSPLFLVHDGSGVLLYAHALAAHLDAQVPIYGLPAVTATESQLLTVHGMAARLVRMMRAVQPVGPYLIAGWSFGGTLAYEVATQLIGADQEVAFLGLLDAFHAPSLGAMQAFAAALDQVAQTPNSTGEAAESTHAGLDQHARSSLLAAATYVAQPIPVQLHLFRASEQLGFAHLGPYGGWDGVQSLQQIRVVTVRGNHHSMLQATNIAGLGEAVNGALRAAMSSPPVPSSRHAPAVLLQGGSAGRVPLICVPGAGASVVGFAELGVALGRSWPLLGLEPRGLSGNQVPYATVEAAVASHAQALQATYPKGPLHILGHSFGGWIAFELSLRMKELGRTVASLTIVDSDGPRRDGRIVERGHSEVVAHLLEIYEQMAGCALQLDPVALADCAPHELQQRLHASLVRAGVMPPRSKPSALAGPMRTFASCVRTSYLPSAGFGGRLRLVVLSDDKLSIDQNRANHVRCADDWRHWAPDLTTWHGPGNHMSVFKPPHVAKLAAWLADQLGAGE